VRIGLISDTHGLLRAEVKTWLGGCDRILHAGDIGTGLILGELNEIAPVTAIRGNNDTDPTVANLPEQTTLILGGVRVLVIHDRNELDLRKLGADLDVVVSGHSHQPRIEEKPGLLFVNPGSAGRRRFHLPIAIGELLIEPDGLTVSLVELAGTQWAPLVQVTIARA
jgi:putative phosphoesterase